MADFFGLMADFSIKICDFTNETLKTQKTASLCTNNININ